MESALRPSQDAAHLLVVDDDPGVLKTFKAILSLSGYITYTAESYDAAAALLQSQSFDVIVADIFLGDRDGIALLEQSQKLNPDTPVILVTGMPTVETASDAVRLNAYDYLSKPVSMDRLSHVVAKALELKVLKTTKKEVEAQNRDYQRNLEALVAERTEKLVQTSKRYQLLFENSRDAIFMASFDGKFLALNEAAVRLFGYQREELIKDNVLVLWSDPLQYERFKKEIGKNGFVKDFSEKFIKKDGEIIDCFLTANLLADPEGQIEGYQGIIRDITPQKRAEEKIRAQNTFLTNVIESLSHPFMVINVADFKVSIVNAAAKRRHKGYGETCYSLSHGLEEPCSRSGQMCPLEEVVKTSLPVHLEHVHVDNGGNESDEEVHAFPLFDDEGRVTQVILYCIDITQKKRLEAAAEAANLMENLGFIFSGICHEIGNPINSLKMALTVLSNNLDNYPIETIREFVGRAMGEITRVEYLLKALKNFSMYEKPVVEPVKMEKFMRHFLGLVEKDFSKKGIEIKLAIPDEKVSALIDQRVFHQVMLNLLTNAADALDEEEGPRIDILLSRLSGFVQVQVKDNGCGMTESEHKNLFRPFFTSKTHGTGLGLVIVKKMLSEMKGTVGISSERHVGTIVTMTLPEGGHQDDA
ncbi:PAS domain S-box protein [Thermodesulfobacteriota bacterium]